MILFPAIDLKDGQCVRLKRGEMDQATVFSDDPASQAKQFEQQGAAWIHVVDLNGAFEGEPVNKEAVAAILDAVSVPVQLGGGIRSMATITMWLEAGISRVILGTAALRNPALVEQACEAYPDKIAVGVDAKGGKVAVEGWAETSDMDVIELAHKFEHTGVACMIYTDVSRDGMMQGPDMEGTRALVEATSIPVIASGGIASVQDLELLKQEIPELYGMISGRAIYEGSIKLSEALEAIA